MKRLLPVVLLALVPRRAQESPLGSLVATLRRQVAPEPAMDDMRRIWETDRWFTFPKFHETARNVAEMKRAAGNSATTAKRKAAKASGSREVSRQKDSCVDGRSSERRRRLRAAASVKAGMNWQRK